MCLLFADFPHHKIEERPPGGHQGHYLSANEVLRVFPRGKSAGILRATIDALLT